MYLVDCSSLLGIPEKIKPVYRVLRQHQRRSTQSAGGKSLGIIGTFSEREKSDATYYHPAGKVPWSVKLG